MKIRRDGRGLVTISPTTAAIVNGEVDLSEWDDEELERGRRRDRRGGWGGKPPVLVASAVHAELTKRRMSKAYDLLRKNTVKAVQVLVEIAGDKKVDASTRLKAVELILDRSLGRVTEKMQLDIGEEKPWQQMIRNATVTLGGIVGNDEQAREALALEAQLSEDATYEREKNERDGTPATLVQGSPNVAPGSTDREEEATPPTGNR